MKNGNMQTFLQRLMAGGYCAEVRQETCMFSWVPAAGRGCGNVACGLTELTRSYCAFLIGPFIWNYFLVWPWLFPCLPFLGSVRPGVRRDNPSTSCPEHRAQPALPATSRKSLLCVCLAFDSGHFFVICIVGARSIESLFKLEIKKHN